MRYTAISDDWFDYPEEIPKEHQVVLVEAGDKKIMQEAVFSDNVFKSNGIKIEDVRRWKPKPISAKS